MKRFALFTALAAAVACSNDAVVQPGPGEPPPTNGVAFVLGPRVEVDDSITVSAAHADGIAMIGWEARLLDGSLFGADSAIASAAWSTIATVGVR